MKNLYLLAVALLLSSPLLSQWTNLSEEGYAIDGSLNAVLNFHPSSHEPYVMLQDYDGITMINIVMRRFNGTEWVDVGGGLIDQVALFNDILDFGFDPNNTNAPIAFYSTGDYLATVKQNGESWEPMLGMDTYFISEPDFDISPAGDPVIGFNDTSCPVEGTNELGSISVVTHEQEWGFIVGQCQSIRPPNYPQIEFNAYDNKLMAFHGGGPDPDENYNGERWLLDYNVSTSEPLAIAEFITDYTPGQMVTNPVNGDTYVYTIEPPFVGSSDRVLTLKRWDGTTLETINTDDILIRFAECDLKVHPISGEIYVIYQDSFQLTEGYPFVVRRFNGTGWVDAYENPEFLSTYGIQDFGFHPVSGDMHIAAFAENPNVSNEWNYYVFTNTPSISVDEITTPSTVIYPNPSTDVLNIIVELFEKAVIHDLRGQLILETSSQEIDITELAPGTYVMKIFANGSSFDEKFVVK